MKLLSVLVGQPHDYGEEGADDPLDRPFRTSFRKDPLLGPVRICRTHVEGDRVADPRYHGGPQMAVLAYAASHYPAWRQELGRDDIGPGGFGENFSILGLDEDSVCSGDPYAVGSVQVQVSLPRLPCANISRFWKTEGLHLRVKETSRTGWYLRVLSVGEVEAGQDLQLLDRPHPEWTVAKASDVWHGRGTDQELADLAACPLLSPDWRQKLAARRERAAPTNP